MVVYAENAEAVLMITAVLFFSRFPKLTSGRPNDPSAVLVDVPHGFCSGMEIIQTIQWKPPVLCTGSDHERVSRRESLSGLLRAMPDSTQGFWVLHLRGGSLGSEFWQRSQSSLSFAACFSSSRLLGVFKEVKWKKGILDIKCIYIKRFLLEVFVPKYSVL